jgi:hypothetical protein
MIKLQSSFEIINFFSKTLLYFLYIKILDFDVCDVTLSVYPHRTSLKNMPGHGGLAFQRS